MSDIAPTLQSGLQQLDQVNAYEFSYDEAALDGIRNLYETKVKHRLGVAFGKTEDSNTPKVDNEGHSLSAVFYGDHLLWLSSNNLKTYTLFKDCFDSLNLSEGIKGLVDYDEKIVMYCGFLIVSYEFSTPMWHVDFQPNANAYTLLTPLFELDSDQGNLLYEDHEGKTSRYHYRPGKGMLIGEGFLHTTEPYARKEKPRVLLSMTIGTDKMEHWNVLGKTVGRQSDFLMLPCGHARGTCACLDQKHIQWQL